MNERYQNDEHQGKTRKSAASAKPKSAAASSVYIKPKTKTKADKKAARRAERQKQAELERKYANPPTEEYKRLRKIWWVLLIGAIACLALSFFLRDSLGEFGFMVILVLSYVFIIAALWLEFSKMKKVRRAYQEKMEAKKTKAQRAQERREKAEAKAAKAEAEKGCGATTRAAPAFFLQIERGAPQMSAGVVSWFQLEICSWKGGANGFPRLC